MTHPLLDSTVSFFEDVALTHKEFFHKVSLAASKFLELGIRPQSVCLINLESKIDTLIAIFALASIKAISSLINPKMLTAPKNKLIQELEADFTIDQLSLSQTPYQLSFDFKAIFLLLASSGSTGNPKWIASSLNHWIKSAEGTICHFQARSYEPWLIELPLFHVSGMVCVFRAFLSNSQMVFKTKNFLFDARISLVSSQISQFQKNNQLALLKKCASLLIGGGKVSHLILKTLQGYSFYLTYGMTESCSQISCTKKNPDYIHEGNILQHRQIFIDNQGQIYVKGDSICDFFWKNKCLIPLKNEEGYFATSDHGWIDSQNNLHILGRRDDRIEIHGEKTYPSQISASLANHFRFNHLYITHVKSKDNTIFIVAFCDPVPSVSDQFLLKQKVGSLFFPQFFFFLDHSIQNQKILRKDLQNMAKQRLKDEFVEIDLAKL